MVLILFALLPIGKMSSLSVSADGFIIQELNQDEYESALLRWSDKIILLNEEPDLKFEIQNVAVNEDGMFAICTDFLGIYIIEVYNSEGEFQYGYKFTMSGKAYVDWMEDRIVIYSVRGDEAIVLDSNGKILEILEVSDTIKNSEYIRKELTQTEKSVNGYTYTLNRKVDFLWDIFLPYPKLIITDVFGNINFVYTANYWVVLFPYLSCLFVIVGFLVVMVIAFLKYKKRAMNFDGGVFDFHSL